jgi:alkanesulfonate monooxygenase SsuD/methylene tetrahydromethanopterin reductase-like flavin-dependent oxidoreductase (luciferase family)
MKFGLFDHVDLGTDPLQVFYEDRLRIAEKYDKAGFYAYHTAEHHATSLGMASSPNVYMSAVAQRTQYLKFGPLVYCLPQYHPIRLFEEICMLDQMSGGRLQVGVGKGISAIESSYYGLDVADVSAIYQEYYQIIMKAMTSERLTFEGKYFSVKDMPLEVKPIQNPHPPIWTGLGNPEATRWPAENRINIISNYNAETVRKITDAYRTEWEGLGYDSEELPLLGMTRFVVISETDEKALAMGRRMYDVWYKSFMKLWRLHNKTPPLAACVETFDEMISGGKAIAGTSESVKEAVDAHIEQSGVNYFVCRFAFGDVTFDEAAYSIDAFSEMYLSN